MPLVMATPSEPVSQFLLSRRPLERHPPAGTPVLSWRPSPACCDNRLSPGAGETHRFSLWRPEHKEPGLPVKPGGQPACAFPLASGVCYDPWLMDTSPQALL